MVTTETALLDRRDDPVCIAAGRSPEKNLELNTSTYKAYDLIESVVACRLIFTTGQLCIIQFNLIEFVSKNVSR